MFSIHRDLRPWHTIDSLSGILASELAVEDANRATDACGGECVVFAQALTILGVTRRMDCCGSDIVTGLYF